MQPYWEESHWVIGRDFRMIDRPASAGPLPRAAAEPVAVYRAWTGRGWADQKCYALPFPAEADVRRYLDANRAWMDQAP